MLHDLEGAGQYVLNLESTVIEVQKLVCRPF